MNSEQRKPEEKPNPTECPKQFCFHWAEKGSRLAEGFYCSLDEALNHMAFVQDDFCACTFGLCIRLDSINGDKDWYEPNEPELERASLPWFYFIPAHTK
jgi:hypothetical protein